MPLNREDCKSCDSFEREQLWDALSDAPHALVQPLHTSGASGDERAALLHVPSHRLSSVPSGITGYSVS